MRSFSNPRPSLLAKAFRLVKSSFVVGFNLMQDVAAIVVGAIPLPTVRNPVSITAASRTGAKPPATRYAVVIGAACELFQVVNPKV
jgi:hypothetical protein